MTASLSVLETLFKDWGVMYVVDSHKKLSLGVEDNIFY
jgi:hypothetical protein